MIVLAPEGIDLRRWCPVHGRCLCGQTHRLTVSALWCFQRTLATWAARPISAYPPRLVMRWVYAHGTRDAPRTETSLITCSDCTAYPALYALTLHVDALSHATRHDRLIVSCTADGCHASGALFSGARMPHTPLDAIEPGDSRLRCGAHQEKMPKCAVGANK